MATFGVRHKFEPINRAFEEGLNSVKPFIMRGLAEMMYAGVRDTITQEKDASPPLREMTKWIKGKNSVRVDSGDFLRALDYQVTPDSATVGLVVPKGTDGQDLEMIARIMEGGAIIRVTEKMRNWFAAQGRPLKKETMVLMIPPRPVFNTALKENTDKIDDVVNTYFDEIVGKI